MPLLELRPHFVRFTTKDNQNLEHMLVINNPYANSIVTGQLIPT